MKKAHLHKAVNNRKEEFAMYSVITVMFAIAMFVAMVAGIIVALRQ